MKPLPSPSTVLVAASSSSSAAAAAAPSAAATLSSSWLSQISPLVANKIIELIVRVTCNPVHLMSQLMAVSAPSWEGHHGSQLLQYRYFWTVSQQFIKFEGYGRLYKDILARSLFFISDTTLAYLSTQFLVSQLGFSLKIASIIGPSLSYLFCYPLDLMATRQATQFTLVSGSYPYPSLSRGIDSVLQTEGPIGLWSGVGFGLLTMLTYRLGHIFTRGAITRSLPLSSKFLNILVHNSLVGFCCYPLLRIHRTLQVQPVVRTEYIGVLDCIKQVGSARGLVGFYQGYQLLFTFEMAAWILPQAIYEHSAWFSRVINVFPDT